MNFLTVSKKAIVSCRWSAEYAVIGRKKPRKLVIRLKYLNEIKPGEHATVAGIAVTDSLRRRLADLGLIPGTTVECVGVSPAGDPSAYLIRGSVIALRRRDCGGILIAGDDR